MVVPEGLSAQLQAVKAMLDSRVPHLEVFRIIDTWAESDRARWSAEKAARSPKFGPGLGSA